MYKFNIIDKISLFLIILTGINTGITGILGFNLINIVLGDPLNLIGRIIYIIIGVAGIDMIIFLFKTKSTYKTHK
ncbi:DUF378 domain-containing protein [Clostridium sp. LBM24168]